MRRKGRSTNRAPFDLERPGFGATAIITSDRRTWLNHQNHLTSQAWNWIFLEWVSPKEGGEAWLIGCIQRRNLIDNHGFALTCFKPLCYTIIFCNGGRGLCTQSLRQAASSIESKLDHWSRSNP